MNIIANVYEKILSYPLADLHDQTIDSLEFYCLSGIDDIATVELCTLDRFLEQCLAPWSNRDIADTSIPIVCLTPDESDLLHREEESRDPTRCESDRICEIDATKALVWRYGERIEYEEV